MEIRTLGALRAEALKTTVDETRENLKAPTLKTKRVGQSRSCFAEQKNTEGIQPVADDRRAPFVNRCLDDCGANSSSAAALCSAAYCTHDKSCAAPPGNAGRRDLRDRPSCGSHGGPDHKIESARSVPAVVGQRS